jgi:hypothetical protein
MSDEKAENTEAPRVDERAVLIEAVTAGNDALKSLIQTLRNNLLRIDEIGAPVTRSRTRADKVEQAREDWWAHFDYDVIKGMTRGTKDQQVRAERYELS